MAIDPKRVKEIFLEAAEHSDEAARTAYLDSACKGDAGLRERVEVLLRSHDPTGSFLGNPAVQPPVPTGDTQELGAGAGVTPDDGADDLKFLSPSRRTDSLGRLGHYEVLQVLGRGGFGIVFRAFDDVLQRVVAVKVMAPQIATLSPARKRFLREAQSSAKIRHENVVQVYEVGEQPLPYLVMEFIPGETLQNKLDRSGPLDVPEILRIGRQIAEGLAAAHASDLIHRDIKPGNVLLEGGSHKVKLTDFGLARAADDASISQSGIVAGTPMFMSPEQALGHTIDQRADLFSLGSVLYQMASGRPPFRAPSALAVLKRVAEELPRPIAEIIPETPDWLCGIVAKLHAKDPKDRFQSAREVADLLADCEAKLKAKQEVKNVLPAAVKPVAPTRSGGRKWLVAAAVLVLPVLVLGVTEFTGVTHLFRGLQATTDPDRKAAEYVLSIGGSVQVNDQNRTITSADELPSDSFRLMWVGLKFNHNVSDGGLANFQGCKDLTFLGLAGANVSNTGLANFQECKKLIFLNLSQTKMGDAGLANFAECRDLSTVVLTGTNVSDAGLAYLKNSRHLTQVFLEKTKVTAAGVDELQKRFPFAKIEWDGSATRPKAPLPVGWVALFNGKDLTGWKTPARADSWQIEEELLVGRSIGAEAYLFSERNDWYDFHLHAEAKINASGDSGVFFRTGPDENGVSPVGGYEAHIGGADHPRPTGSLFQLRPIATAPPNTIKPGEWFTFDVLVQGRQLTFKLNGTDVMKHVLDDEKSPHGQLALQVWGPDTVVHFKRIQIRELAPVPIAKQEPSGAPHVVAPFTDADVKRIAVLPAAEQIEEVRKELKKRNPEFDGQLQSSGGGPVPTIEKGVVVNLALSTDKVSDISPLRALTGLRYLGISCAATGKAGLADLSPLKGLPLVALYAGGNSKLTDLSPLQGMPINALSLWGTSILNIDVVKEMPIKRLWLEGTKVVDLSPLAGKCLELLAVGPVVEKGPTGIQAAKEIKSLSCGLAQLPEEAELQRLGVTELSVWSVPKTADPDQLAALGPRLKLINMKFADEFWKENPTVHDTWLKAINLVTLDQHAAALPAKLKEKLPAFDGAFLRAMPAMAAERQGIMARAWLEERKPAFAGHEHAWLKAIPSLSGDAQAVLVAAWLKERNPSYDGEIAPKIEGGELTILEVTSPLVQDLTPLQALTGLKTLTGRATLGYDHKAEVDAPLLRSLRKLETINGKPAAQFWKDVDAKQTEFKEWLKLVPALAGKQQVDAVAAKLKERNPGFDGDVAHMIEDAVVTELLFKGENVTDLSPVRALAGLKILACANGPLTDLSPLKGMPLTSLNIEASQVRDLGPIKGMPLVSLNLSGAKVEDLSALKDMPLKTLHLSYTKVRDLSPLEGLPLTALYCHDSYEVRDLTPLKGMPLTDLHLWQCPVADLTPLKGMPLAKLGLCGNRGDVQDLEALKDMPLTWLNVVSCAKVQSLEPLKGLKLAYLDLNDCPQVRDLAPLAGMPLKTLRIQRTGITDLSPLKDIPLEEVRLIPKEITKGLDILRAMKSLKTIGISGGDQVWPADQFWERFDKGEFK